MLESAQASQLEGYYAWESPAKHLTVLLSLRTVDELQKCFHDARQSRTEIGGFLLGGSEHAGPGRFITTIDDFDVVESDRQRGPHYELNERDRKRFARRISRARSERDPRLVPVGFFRTHLRPGLFLTAIDLGLMQNFFPGPTDVALLVSPERDSIGGFFLQEDGRISAEPYRFPFDRKQLQQHGFTILKSPEANPGNWLRPLRTRSAWALRWLWAAAGTLAVALAVLANYAIRSGLKETVQPAMLVSQNRGDAKAAPQRVQHSGSADRSIESASTVVTHSPPRKSRVKMRGKRVKRSAQRKPRHQ